MAKELKEGSNTMTFKELAAARYSVKNYTDQPVEEEKLQEILKVAGIAPTARNAQAIRIYVLKSEAAMEKAKTVTPCIFGAPICLMLAYNEEEVFFYPDEDNGVNSGAEDCSIVATHIMFEAVEQGLGTCWVNKFSPSEAKRVFELPEKEHVVLFMPLGYASEKGKPLPKHTQKKPLSDIVIEL